jgi:catechol 2,3-dioxygenase-like lactoylglutathione lyase family enzyme
VDLDHLNLRVRDAEACRDFYVEHFGFEPAFEADGGYFLRNRHGFLLALVPASTHQHLPDGFHIGFSLDSPDEVVAVQASLVASGVETTEVQDSRPGEDYVTFRCWDPDGTEIELFWEA